MLKTRPLTAALVAAALATTGGTADGKKKKPCKEGSEHAGCTLKNGASYSGRASGGVVAVNVESDDVIVSTKANPRTAGTSGSICGNARAKVASAHVKVGKKYDFTGNSTNSLGRFTLQGSVKFGSAKVAHVAGVIQQFDRHTRKLTCRTNFDADLDRR